MFPRHNVEGTVVHIFFETPIHGEMVVPAKLSNEPRAKRHGRIPSQAHELKNKPGEKFTEIQKHPEDA